MNLIVLNFHILENHLIDWLCKPPETPQNHLKTVNLLYLQNKCLGRNWTEICVLMWCFCTVTNFVYYHNQFPLTQFHAPNRSVGIFWRSNVYCTYSEINSSEPKINVLNGDFFYTTTTTHTVKIRLSVSNICVIVQLDEFYGLHYVN